jgi:hypothetical protein
MEDVETVESGATFYPLHADCLAGIRRSSSGVLPAAV